MKLQAIAADVPPELAEVDELLELFGLWATQGKRSRCDAIARRYHNPDRWRWAGPRPPLTAPRRLTSDQAGQVQRVFGQLEPQLRAVLAALYVPRDRPAEVQLLDLGVDPATSRALHLAALQAFERLRRR